MHTMNEAKKGQCVADAISLSSDDEAATSSDQNAREAEMSRKLGSKALEILKDAIEFQKLRWQDGATTDIDRHTRDLMYAARQIVMDTMQNGEKLCDDAGWQDRQMKKQHRCTCKRKCSCGGSYWY